MTAPPFTLEVEGTSGSCASGERWATDHLSRHSIPVLSCEGPCIRGDIARLAANFISKQPPYARACYAETVLVPHSTMASWVKEADAVLVIDGCFLNCMKRLLANVVTAEKVIHVDALEFHKKYSKIFHMDEIPAAEREETARRTADGILDFIAKGTPSPPCGCGSCCG